MKRLLFSLLLGLALVVAPGSAHAQAPTSISVQGIASDDGTPLADGTYTVDLRLYTQESGGEPIDEQTASVEVRDGRFAALMDAEGLAFDAEATRLLIACKESPGRDYWGSRTIYAFDPSTNRLDPVPAFVIRREALAGEGDGLSEAVRSLVEPVFDFNAFKPSALAVHPLTGEVYVLSSVRKVVLVLDRAGAVVARWPLSESLLPQPEGLAFAPDGTLFVASEADGGTAVLLRFDYRL